MMFSRRTYIYINYKFHNNLFIWFCLTREFPEIFWQWVMLECSLTMTQELTHALKGDPACIRTTQVGRLPGSINCKPAKGNRVRFGVRPDPEQVGRGVHAAHEGTSHWATGLRLQPIGQWRSVSFWLEDDVWIFRTRSYSNSGHCIDCAFRSVALQLSFCQQKGETINLQTRPGIPRHTWESKGIP